MKEVYAIDHKAGSKEKLPKIPSKLKGLCKRAFRTSPQRQWKRRAQVQGTSPTTEKLEARAKRTAADPMSQEEDFVPKSSKLEVNSKNVLIYSQSLA